MDDGERWRSGRARGAKGQEIRGKGVKGNKWEVSAGVKRGELHSLKMRSSSDKELIRGIKTVRQN